MFQKCCVETMPSDNTLWLKLKEPLCNTTQENDSNLMLIQDISKKFCEIAQTQIVENLSSLGNQLPHLPNNFAESLTNLVHLNLSNNKLNDLPNSLKILKKLVYLNLDHNKFVFIPNIICDLDSLKTLTAQENCIKIVPEELNSLSNLEHLNLSSNNLDNLPISYKNLNCLRNFSLANNRFKMIPKCITNGMHNLEIFNFSKNGYSDLNISPKSVNLIAFYAEENNFCSSFPLWILDTKYNKLEIVSLNGTRFKKFNLPDKPSISCIKKLSMKECKIFEINVETITARMTNLEQLIIGNSRAYCANRFWYMPIESLKEPSHLKEIDASGTSISVIPRTISNFINLSKMDVSSNEIHWLPDEICSLKNLTSLIAYKNKMAILPRNIGEMISLRELIVSYNNLNELPESIELLSNLQYVDLYNNEFETVPEVMEKLSNLVGLDLEQNYFSTDRILFNRYVHYECMRNILRDHWCEVDRIIDGAKSKPSEEPEVYFDNRKRYSSSSSSTSSSSSNKTYIPEEFLNQTNNEHWDSSEDSADEFDPHECKEPRIHFHPPLIYYNTFQPTYCPGDSHQTRTVTRIAQILQNGTPVQPTNYEEDQFEDS